MNRKRYIPRSDAEYDVFFGNIIDYVDKMTSGASPKWDHIPQSALQELRGTHGDWTTAYELVKVPHTPVQTAEKNRVRKSSEGALRNFVNRFLRYEPVTDEDRDSMDIPNHKVGRSPVPVPTTSPQLIIDTGTRRRLIIFYKDEKSERRGKPDGVHGIEIRWAILDHTPESIQELINSAFDTKSPLVLEFDEHDRGKHVYMAGCWEIGREGEKGPYGAIVDAIIP